MKKTITHKPKSKRYKVKRYKQRHKVGRNYGFKKERKLIEIASESDIDKALLAKIRQKHGREGIPKMELTIKEGQALHRKLEEKGDVRLAEEVKERVSEKLEKRKKKKEIAKALLSEVESTYNQSFKKNYGSRKIGMKVGKRRFLDYGNAPLEIDISKDPEKEEWKSLGPAQKTLDEIQERTHVEITPVDLFANPDTVGKVIKSVYPETQGWRIKPLDKKEPTIDLFFEKEKKKNQGFMPWNIRRIKFSGKKQDIVDKVKKFYKENPSELSKRGSPVIKVHVEHLGQKQTSKGPKPVILLTRVHKSGRTSQDWFEE
jgi:hypothetical protein